jgi:hypothetical protein
MCLLGQGLRVTGGPVFPSESQAPEGADGELIVGSGAGGAFIAFYRDASRAKRLEPDVAQNARRLGGQAERRGAVTVLWIRPPTSGLRKSMRACQLG